MTVLIRLQNQTKNFLGGTMSTTEITPATIPPTTDKSKRRKAKAILAGGLVLGIGAAVTLAAWNDSEFVIGNFGGGHFSIQGSTDGVSFGDHKVEGSPLELTFRASSGLAASTSDDALSPGETVATPYVVRLDSASDYDADVSIISKVPALSDASDLLYEVIPVASVDACNGDATATPIVAQTSIGTAPNSVDGGFSLGKSANGTDAGTAVVLCFKVTAGPGLDQDASADAVWELRATAV